MVTDRRPMQDGPNTHRYRDADHVMTWTVVPTPDGHNWHVPNYVLEAAAPSPALTRDSDELRKAVERVAELENGIREFVEAEAAWTANGLSADLGSVADRKAADLRALLSAGDKAEAPPHE